MPNNLTLDDILSIAIPPEMRVIGRPDGSSKEVDISKTTREEVKAQIAEAITHIIGPNFEVSLEFACKHQLSMKQVSQIGQINKWKDEQRERLREFLESSND